MGTLGKIVFRGYAKKENNIWVAICIDLNIAAEGSTPEDAIQTCAELIAEYLAYVCKNYPKQVHKYIPRPAPKEFIEEYNHLLGNKIIKPEQKKSKNEIWDFSPQPSELVACRA